MRKKKLTIDEFLELVKAEGTIDEGLIKFDYDLVERFNLGNVVGTEDQIVTVLNALRTAALLVVKEGFLNNAEDDLADTDLSEHHYNA